MHKGFASVLLVAIVWCAGCTSFQKTEVEDIEAHPGDYLGKKLRAHFDGTIDSTLVQQKPGRSLRHGMDWSPSPPDSVVSIKVARIDYPVLLGTNPVEAKMYGAMDVPTPLTINLAGSRKVEVHGFSAGRTLLLMGAVALVAGVIYGAAQAAGDAGAKALGETIGCIFGGCQPPVTPPPSPPRN